MGQCIPIPQFAPFSPLALFYPVKIFAHTLVNTMTISKLCPHSLQVHVPCPPLGYRGIYISSEFRLQKDRPKNKLYPGHGRGSLDIWEGHALAWVSGAWSGYGFPDVDISPWSSKLPSHRKRHGTGGPEQALSNLGPEKSPRAAHNTENLRDSKHLGECKSWELIYSHNGF